MIIFLVAGIVSLWASAMCPEVSPLPFVIAAGICFGSASICYENLKEKIRKSEGADDEQAD